MSDLIVVSFPDELQAEEVRLRLLKLQREYLVDLEDAVVVLRKDDGKVKLRQLHNLTASGAIGGGFWGTLVGLLFLNPLFGLAIGSAAGGASSETISAPGNSVISLTMAGSRRARSSRSRASRWRRS